MKKNLIFGCSLLIASAWVVYSSLFFYSNSLKILSPQSFFTTQDTVYIVNNYREFQTENIHLKLHKTHLDSILNQLENKPFWEKIYFTKKDDSTIGKLMLEGKRALNVKDLISIYKLFGIDTTLAEIGKIVPLDFGTSLGGQKYFTIAQQPIVLLGVKDEKLNFNTCDSRATYNILSKNDRKDVYKTSTRSQVYITQQTKTSFNAVSDRDFYAVIPSNTSGFLFIEKNLLLSTFPKWKENKLLPIFEKGIMQAQFDGKKIALFAINGQYTPNEIKSLFAKDESYKNASVFPLNIATPNFQKPYATCLENMLILSAHKQTLEDLRVYYQIGKIFNTTRFYTNMVNTKPKEISVRWWGEHDLSLFNVPKTKEGSIVYQENAGQRVLVLNQVNSHTKANDFSKYKLLWTKTVGNASSIKTIKGLIAVWDKSNHKITVVSDNAEVTRTVRLKRTYLELKALRDGFVLIGKTNMLWIPTNNKEKTVAHDFEFQLQNIAADYTWEGRQELAFLTKKNLICFNVKSSKITTYKLPKSVGSPTNFYAFNYNGNLGFSMTNDKATVLFDTKTDKSERKKREGEIVSVEKFGLDVYYLLKNKVSFKIQKNDEATSHLSVPEDYVFFGSQNTDNVTCFVFRKNNHFVVYDLNNRQFSQFKASINTVEKVAVAKTNKNKKVIIFLDGVQNNLYLQIENQPKGESHHIEGSHFVYSKTTTQFITYLDGNLVCYQLNN